MEYIIDYDKINEHNLIFKMPIKTKTKNILISIRFYFQTNISHSNISL